MSSHAETGSRAASHGRIFELDSLRGLAALAVVVYHFDSHFHQHPLFAVLGPLYQDGWRAVDFFFVLSGFVLARAYWTASRKDRLLRNVWDRIGRLYPLHFVTLLAVAAGQWFLLFGMHQGSYVYHLNDGYHFVLNLFLLQGSDSSFNGPSWSISTEFVINLVFFLVILLPQRWAIVAFLVAIAATFLPLSQETMDVISPFSRTLRGFCIGVMLHHVLAASTPRQSAWLPRLATFTFVAVGAFLVVYAYWLERLPLFSGGITLVAFCLLIASAPLSPLAQRLLRPAPLVYLGEISYSVYLIHFPLQLLLWLLYVTLGLTWPFGPLAGLIAFLAVSVVCAAQTYRYVELPGKRWLRLPQKKRLDDAIA